MSEKSALEGKRFTDQPTLGTSLRGDEILLLHNSTGVKQVEAKDFLGQLAYDQIETPYGRDLTVLFADEIAKFSDPWQWIKNRIKTNNISDLKVNDYIPMKTSEGLAFDMQIMGCPYSKNYGDNPIGYYLDFCSRTLYPTAHNWNDANDNNGTADNPNPFLASKLKAWIDSTIYPTLPTEVKNVIGGKRMWLVDRYSASGKLTDDNGHHWTTLNGLWVPDEREVSGDTNWGTKGYSSEGSWQYPYFKYSENRNKVDTNGARRIWWVATARSGYSAYVCNLAAYGFLGSYYASDLYRVPLCFRILAS